MAMAPVSKTGWAQTLVSSSLTPSATTFGEMPERSIGSVLKTEEGKLLRGFESHSLRHRGVAQLEEQPSPKRSVAGSSPVTPATYRSLGPSAIFRRETGRWIERRGRGRTKKADEPTVILEGTRIGEERLC